MRLKFSLFPLASWAHPLLGGSLGHEALSYIFLLSTHKISFLELDLFHMFSSFNGKLATHTWFLLYFSLGLRRACTITFPLLI